MSHSIKAPWTPEQVKNLEAHQNNPEVHPFTCGNRHLSEHKEYAEKHAQRDHGILVPTLNGWVCPVCDYTQDWAHPMMVDGSTAKI